MVGAIAKKYEICGEKTCVYFEHRGL